MGLILGRLVEESLSQSMIIFDNNWLRFFESPICLLFFALTLLGLFWSPLISALQRRGAPRRVPGAAP
jgi:putative tricarboxylic transport membrane protein